MPAVADASLEPAFRLAAGELGMSSASWLFIEEVEAEAGREGLLALRERLGRAFPVLDATVAARLDGVPGPDLATGPLVELCAGATRVVIVGHESRFLDALMRALPATPVWLVTTGVLDTDWERVASNHDARLTLVDLDGFQRGAGARSVLLTWIYGHDETTTYALPGWARAVSEDVRVQFRSLVGWDVLGRAFYVYPRWLVRFPRASFTHVVPR
jgi:hypothetical protein